MIRWYKVFQYAIALFAAQFLTGFIEGLLLPAGASSLLSTQSVASSMVSLLLCTAIFVHLAVHQGDRPVEHGSLALLVQLAIGALATLATPSWLVGASAAELVVDLLVLIAALAVGTSLGIRLRKRYASRAEA